MLTFSQNISAVFRRSYPSWYVVAYYGGEYPCCDVARED
jgi:hypothetical protein